MPCPQCGEAATCDIADVGVGVIERGNFSCGIRISFETRGQAVNFRQRCYRLKQLEKKDSFKTYPEGDSRRGSCVYDELAFDVPAGLPELIIMKRGLQGLKIEEI